MALNIFPFYYLSTNQLLHEFETSKEKLKEILVNANLQKFLRPCKQFFNQLGVNCRYFVEDEFNANLKNFDDSKLSIFHLNIGSFNCHHKELSVYLSLLNIQFHMPI